MLRASSDPIIFAEAIETIKKALIARSYPLKLINKTLKRITYKDSNFKMLKFNVLGCNMEIISISFILYNNIYILNCVYYFKDTNN